MNGIVCATCQSELVDESLVVIHCKAGHKIEFSKNFDRLGSLQQLAVPTDGCVEQEDLIRGDKA